MRGDLSLEAGRRSLDIRLNQRIRHKVIGGSVSVDHPLVFPNAFGDYFHEPYAGVHDNTLAGFKQSLRDTVNLCALQVC